MRLSSTGTRLIGWGQSHSEKCWVHTSHGRGGKGGDCQGKAQVIVATAINQGSYDLRPGTLNKELLTLNRRQTMTLGANLGYHWHTLATKMAQLMPPR